MKKFFSFLLVALLIAMFCIPRVTGESDKVLITMQIGNNTAYVDGALVSLDVPPQIIKGRTLVPIRFVSENLGAEVGWESNTKTVTITMDSIPYLKNRISSLEAEKTDLTTKSNILQNKISELQAKNDELNKEISELTTKNTELNSTITALQNQIEELQKGKIVFLKPPYYLIEGKNHVLGFHPEFYEEFKKKGENVGLLGGYPLVEGVERHLDEIRSSTSILVIPPTPEGIQEFRDLENKYSDLCPLSGDKLVESLKSYSSPLLYFSQDPETYKIRGIIVAGQVDSSLAELLLSKGVTLDNPFRYENEQLVILK